MPGAAPSDYFPKAIALAATALALAGSFAAIGIGLLLAFPDNTTIVRIGVAILVVAEAFALINAIRAWRYYRIGSALMDGAADQPHRA